jgi:hypothetical protein
MTSKRLPSGRTMPCYSLSELATYTGTTTESLKKRFQRCNLSPSGLFKVPLYSKKVMGQEIVIKGVTEWAAFRLKTLFEKLNIQQGEYSREELDKWLRIIFQIERNMIIEGKEPPEKLLIYRDYYNSKNALADYLGVAN